MARVAGLFCLICGSNSVARTMGPAMRQGKKEMKNKYSSRLSVGCNLRL